MWISAKTAMILLAALLALAVLAVASPLLPRPRLPLLPAERVAQTAADKLGPALAILDAPERARAQRMLVGAPILEGSARCGERTGTGPAAVPGDETLRRLAVLLKDARTASDPRAAKAEPTYVVRFVRGADKLDVMVDPDHDRLVLAMGGKVLGTFSAASLHREYANLGETLFP